MTYNLAQTKVKTKPTQHKTLFTFILISNEINWFLEVIAVSTDPKMKFRCAKIDLNKISFRGGCQWYNFKKYQSNAYQPSVLSLVSTRRHFPLGIYCCAKR